jgi:hypothetical protein
VNISKTNTLTVTWFFEMTTKYYASNRTMRQVQCRRMADAAEHLSAIVHVEFFSFMLGLNTLYMNKAIAVKHN